MANDAARKFYITLLRKNGEAFGHVVSEKPRSAEEASSEKLGGPQSKEVSADKTPALNFATVCRDFVSSMESYRKFISLTLAIATQLSASIAEKRIGDFVKSRGVERSDLSTEDEKVYELDLDYYREFLVHNDEARNALEGARNLPQVMIIGLVSAYDAFLSQLLRVVLTMHEEIVLTSEKSIKFSELSEFNSIEQARASLIDREIEAVLRESHHEQFAWMERRLSVSLRKDLTVWPMFIELCERRNLLTHTGGIVTDQYIGNCKAQGVDLSTVVLGSRLKVTPKYYSQAVAITYEIGVKLIHVLWRKFDKEGRTEADSALLNLGFDLIYERVYPIAEVLLKFGVTTLKTHASEEVRCMMVVNLANAIRLQKREAEAKKMLDSEDWSAASDKFKISVAAVSGRKKDVIDLMKQIGRDRKVGPEAYRTWPVFRGMRTDKEFIEAFENIFGEPLISAKRVEISKPVEAPDSELETDLIEMDVKPVLN